MADSTVERMRMNAKAELTDTPEQGEVFDKAQVVR